MDRLRLLLLVAFTIVTSRSLSAQLTPGSGLVQPAELQSTSASFVVIGDVSACNQYAMNPVQPITVRDAVIAAQPVAGSLSVSILRDGQDRVQWTQMLYAESPDSGEHVRSGDILIVHAIGSATTTVMRNAALRTPAGVVVVALADETVAVGDVLLQTGSMPGSTVPLQIAHRLQGRPVVAQATLSELVAHGDVVCVGLPAADLDAATRRGLVPAFSEWQSSDSQSSELTSATMIPSQAGFDSIATPLIASPTESQSYAIEVVEPLADPAEPVEEHGADRALLEVPDPFLNAAGRIPEADLLTIPVTQSQIIEDATATRAVDVGSVTISTETAPVPPSEQPLGVTPAATEISAWNILFISGLLIAGSLILAGSLRVDDDVDSVASADSRATTATETAPVVVRFPAYAETGDRESFAASLEPFVYGRELPPSSRPQPVTQHNAGPIRNLVIATEWFSGDWINSTPAVVAPSATVSRVEQISIPQIAITEPDRVAPVVNMEERVSTERRLDVNAAESVKDELDSELEDLLQNRLPVDLQQAKLPLRVALFGRPAGPRYLRIDAAHTQLAGPHTRSAGERGRESTGSAAVSARRSSTVSVDDRDSETTQQERARS